MMLPEEDKLAEHLMGASHFMELRKQCQEKYMPPDVEAIGDWWQEFKADERADVEGSLYYNHFNGAIWDKELKEKVPQKEEWIPPY